MVLELRRDMCGHTVNDSLPVAALLERRLRKAPELARMQPFQRHVARASPSARMPIVRCWATCRL